MSSTLWSENDKLGKSEDILSQIVGGKGYFYAQNMRDDGKGKREGLVYKADIRTKLIVPLVRRIYIDQENNPECPKSLLGNLQDHQSHPKNDKELI